jgi:hypothetical protein
MGALAFGFLIAPIVLLALIVMSLWAVLRCCVPPLRRRSGTSACAKCGYSVLDQSGFVCPECGSDLRTVGIATPYARYRTRAMLPAALLGWLFLVLVGVGAAFAWVVVPYSISVTTYRCAIPKSGRFAHADFWLGDGLFPGHEYTLMVALSNGNRQSVLEMDTKSGEAAVYGDKGAELMNGRYGGPETVRTLFAAAGLEATDVGIAEERDVADIIASLLQNPWLRSQVAQSSSFTDSTTGPATAQPPYRKFHNAHAPEFVILGGGVLLGIGGCVGITRRRRTLLHRLATQQPR